MQALLVAVLFLALLIAVFALQNAGFVPIRLLFWQFDVSLVLVILGSALLGALAVLLAGLFRRRARAKKQETKEGEPAQTAPAPATAEKKKDG